MVDRHPDSLAAAVQDFAPRLPSTWLLEAPQSGPLLVEYTGLVRHQLSAALHFLLGRSVHGKDVPKVGDPFFRDTHTAGRQPRGPQCSSRPDQFPSPRPFPNTTLRRRQTAVAALLLQSANPCSSPANNQASSVNIEARRNSFGQCASAPMAGR